MQIRDRYLMIDSQIYRCKDRERYICVDKQKDRRKDKQKDWQKVWLIDRMLHRKIYKQDRKIIR